MSTHNIPFSIWKKHLKLSQIRSCGIFFEGTEERVRNSRGKRAISVRAIEVLLYLTRKETDGFYFLSFLGFWETRHIINRCLLLLYMCIIHIYFPFDWAFKILYMIQKHVFARAKLCISSFACKLLCRHFTLIAKMNSCTNFNVRSSIIMIYSSKIRGILQLWFFAPMLTSTNTLDV